MSLSLSASKDLLARKELARLRIEMHRQQLLYHSQPLTHPLRQISRLLFRPRSESGPAAQAPALMIAGLLLALFGRRLGKFGLIARIGLGIYPLFQLRQRRHRASP